MSLLRTERISKSFGGVHALKSIDLSVERGHIHAIIGTNGAGKTTLINAISGFFAPSSGRVTFDGRDITGLAPDRVARAGIARTFQNIELFEHATVLENLLLGRYRHRRVNLVQEMLFLPAVRREALADRAAVEEVIDYLELGQWRDHVVAGLAYGVRKQIELGRALALQPDLLILDEPASGLTPEETGELAYLLTDMVRHRNMTILMIEHDMGLVGGVADRVLAMNTGAAIAEGTAAEVQSHPDVLDCYLGTQAA
ncbi:ABC transporter ATP-binding protein [Pseudooceanicola aestuarii]|uniref:ABC transporter ATP-binding protein n=1 Tax=Pseudooceanicola aestuarii TaxID=2697319 RepID=UPI0013D68A24|nr:ABC transporter ATP-binding protein [Pseudooceanicola aestuarii]